MSDRSVRSYLIRLVTLTARSYWITTFTVWFGLGPCFNTQASMFLTVTAEPLIQCTYFIQSERGVLHGTGLFRWIWCWTHIPRRFHRRFPSDFQIRCCRGALCNLENQHTLVHTNTLIKRCTHTGKCKITKQQKNYWATSTHPFVSLLFLCVCFFSVLWMVVSLGLYNCVYIIWVIYHFNFVFLLFLLVCDCSYFVLEKSTTCEVYVLDSV